jgi:hypothetical protein
LAKKQSKPTDNTTALSYIPADKREQIKKLLLDDNKKTADDGKNIQPDSLSYSRIALQLSVPVSVVRAVAKSLSGELRALDNARKDEFKRDLLTGSKLALARILESVENGSMTERQLIYAFGIMADKYMALEADEKPQAGPAVAFVGGDGVADFAKAIVDVLQKAADRQRVIDVTPIEESGQDESEPS